MRLTSILLILAVGLLCATLSESRPGRGNGRGNRRGGIRGSRPGRPGKGGPKPVLACSTGSEEEEELDCGRKSNCTAGPLRVTFNGSDVDVTFCEKPFKPQVRGFT